MASLVTTTVAGTLTVNPDADSALEIVNGGTNAIVLRAKTGDELYVGSNGANAVRFPSAGGIDVTGTVTGSTFGSINLTTSTQHVKWPFTSGQANSRSWGWIAEQGAYGYFQLYRSDASDGTLDTEVMRFRNTGNAEFRNDLLVDGNLFLTTSGNYPYLKITTTSTAAAAMSYIQLNTTAGNGYLIKNRDTGNSMLSKSLYLWNDSGPIQFITPSSTLRMTIEQGGNVGIGTSAPGAKLHVNGVSYFTGGDVAIGTTTPSSNYSRQLHVHATGTGASLHLTDSTSGLANGDGFELISHAGNAYVWQRESNSLIFGTAANEKMRIISDGNVGIGTTAPTTLFQSDVNSASVGTDSITARNRGVTTIGHTVGYGYQFNSAVPAASRAIIENINSGLGRLGFFVSTDATAGNLTEYLSIKSDGKVGIGTTSPEAKLHISQDNNSEYSPTGDPYNNAIVQIRNTNTTASIPASLIHFRLDKNGGDGYLGFITDGSTGNVEHFVLGTQTGNEMLRINKDGNVGIGTTAPATTLDVNGIITSRDLIKIGAAGIHGQITFLSDRLILNGASGKALSLGTNGAWDKLFMDTAGKVGIGTTGPSVALEIKTPASADAFKIIDRSSSDVIVYASFGSTSDEGLFDLLKNNLTKVRLRANGVSYFTGGGVAIGTTALGGVSKLEVQRAARTTVFNAGDGDTWHDLIVRNPTNSSNAASGITFLMNNTYHKNAGTGIAAIAGPTSDYSASLAFITRPHGAVAVERMRIQYDGNVGIGTTAPAYKLDVNGAARIVDGISSPAFWFRPSSTAVHCWQPKGGYYHAGGNVHTGAIRIKLPPMHDAMVTFWVDVYDYRNNENFSVYVGGYPYASPNPTWSYTSAVIIGGVARNFTVRFGDNNLTGSSTEYYVYIGETDSEWNHPQVVVRDVFSGYATSSADWEGGDAGWGVSFATSFANIANTQSNTLPYGDYNKLINKPAAGVTGTGTDNYVPRWNGTTALQNSSIYADDNGNVGVGNAVPGNFKLNVSGAVYASGSVVIANGTPYFGALNSAGAAQQLLTLNSSNQLLLGSSGIANSGYPARVLAKYITFEPAGTLGAPVETMRVTNASFNSVGSVGIGIAAPVRLLHVYSGTENDVVANFSSLSNSSSAPAAGLTTHIDVGSGHVTNGVARITGHHNLYQDSRSYLSFSTNSGSGVGEKMRIMHDGNVGIGTTVPTERLDVEGSLVLNVATGSGLGEEGIFFRRGYSTSYKYNVSILAYAHDGSGNFSDGLSINGYDGVSFCTGSNTRQERMRVVGGSGATSGYVGIGTITPAAKLHVYTGSYNTPKLILQDTGGGAGLVNQIEFRHYTDGRVQAYIKDEILSGWLTKLHFGTANSSNAPTTKMTIDGVGNVGIGTASPSKNLHIRSTVSGSTGIIIENTNNAQNLDIDYWNNAGAVQGRIRYSEGAGDFYIYPNTSALVAFAVKWDGKVGIGTAAPNYKLEVRGTDNNQRLGIQPNTATAKRMHLAYNSYLSSNTNWYGSYAGSTGMITFYEEGVYQTNVGGIGFNINRITSDNTAVGVNPAPANDNYY